MEDKKTKSVFIKTYGCQMNFHDSGLIKDGLLQKGFKIAGSPIDADIVIFNTCSVRDHAEHKIISDIGRIKENKTVVLAGCFASQVKLKIKSGLNIKNKKMHLDYCFSPDEVMSIPEALTKENGPNVRRNSLQRSPFAESGRGFDNSLDSSGGDLDLKGKDDYQNLDLLKDYFYNKNIDASYETIKITEGCNNYCSYCIVPFVRGKERSVPFDIIHNTAKIYADKGVRDIMLLGQNVNSYLSPDDDKKDFSFLLESLSKIDGIKKIRFMSSHPKDFNENVIRLIGKNNKISKSIHLPAQSGSDKMLSAMNRGYTVKDYIGLAEKIRKEYPDAMLSTDIIVGFPGETDEDFNMTLSLLEEVKFDSIFGFKYSPRPFTKAFKIKDDILTDKKKERLEILFEKQRTIFTSILHSLVGRTVNATIERVKNNEKNRQKSVFYKAVALNDRIIYIENSNADFNDGIVFKDDLKTGEEKTIKITGVKNNRLYGEIKI